MKENSIITVLYVTKTSQESKDLTSILNSVEKTTKIVFASLQANEFNMVLTPNSIQSSKKWAQDFIEKC